MHQVRPRLHKSRTLVVTDGKSLNLILTWALDSTQPHENVLGICLELTDMSTLTHSGRLRQCLSFTSVAPIRRPPLADRSVSYAVPLPWRSAWDDEASASHEARCMDAGVDQPDMACDMPEGTHARHERQKRGSSQPVPYRSWCNVCTKIFVLPDVCCFLHYTTLLNSASRSFVTSVLVDCREPKQVKRCRKLPAVFCSQSYPTDA